MPWRKMLWIACRPAIPVGIEWHREIRGAPPCLAPSSCRWGDSLLFTYSQMGPGGRPANRQADNPETDIQAAKLASDHKTTNKQTDRRMEAGRQTWKSRRILKLKAGQFYKLIDQQTNRQTFRQLSRRAHTMTPPMLFWLRAVALYFWQAASKGYTDESAMVRLVLWAYDHLPHEQRS